MATITQQDLDSLQEILSNRGITREEVLIRRGNLTPLVALVQTPRCAATGEILSKSMIWQILHGAHKATLWVDHPMAVHKALTPHDRVEELESLKVNEETLVLGVRVRREILWITMAIVWAVYPPKSPQCPIILNDMGKVLSHITSLALSGQPW